MAEEAIQQDEEAALATATDAVPAEAAADAGASSPAQSDPLDELLSEYDQRVGNGNGAAAGDADELDQLLGSADDAADRAAEEQQRTLAWQAEQQRYADAAAQSAMDIAQKGQHVAELQQTVSQLQNVIAQEQWRQRQEKSREDFEKLAASEQQKLSDVAGIDEDHVRRWLLSEAAQDPRLGEAWEASRYYEPPGPIGRARIAGHIQQWGENQAKLALQLPDPRARLLAQQNIESEMRRLWETAFPDPAAYRANASAYVRKAIDRMHREARKPRLDPDRTADRFAVAQAVRGASGKFDAAEPPPNFSRMSDGEFARATKQLYGF